MKTYTLKEFIKLLNDNDYLRERGNGEHLIFTNGKYRIAVPNHRNINVLTARKIIKLYNLKEE